jgi:sugar phosphate isomerase/epimerase
MSSVLPLAYSTNGFTERSLEDALKLISEIGYTGVELLGDRPHWSADSGSKLKPQILRSILVDLNLSVSNVNGNTAMFAWPDWLPETIFEPSLSNSDPKIRQKRIDYCLALLDWAKEVGAPRVSVTSGRCPGQSLPEIETAYFIESLHILCERAAELGLQLSVEYEPGLLIERWTELLAVIQQVSHPSLGANLDLGHARCIGENPIEALVGLKDYLWNIHIEDIRGDKHYHLIPGEGDMPFGDITKTLRQIGYQGYLTVELYTYSQSTDNQDQLAAKKSI